MSNHRISTFNLSTGGITLSLSKCAFKYIKGNSCTLVGKYQRTFFEQAIAWTAQLNIVITRTFPKHRVRMKRGG